MAKSKKGSTRKGSEAAASTSEGPSPRKIAERQRSKAYFLREKVKAGATLDATQAAWLAQYEAAADKSTPIRVADVPPDPAAAPPPTAAAAPPPPDPEPAELPPTPPPPRIGGSPAATRRPGGRWQDGYQYGQGEAQGREATCKLGAQVWLGTLELLAGQLREIGVDPLVEPKSLEGAIVLTLDAVLPPEIELTPELVAAGGTTAILVQRVVHAKAIKERQDRAKARSSSRPVVDVMADDGAPGPATPPEARPEPEPPPLSTEPAIVPPPPPPEPALESEPPPSTNGIRGGRQTFDRAAPWGGERVI